MMMMLRPSLETGLSWIAVAALAILVGTDARPAPAAEPEIHSAPVENLEHIGLSLIRSATKSVDVAAYTLTDAETQSNFRQAPTRASIPSTSSCHARTSSASPDEARHARRSHRLASSITCASRLAPVTVSRWP
jgi:hypothetical protein